MTLQKRLHLDKSPIFLMDGSAFLYRGFFANRVMQRSDGFPTNALVVVFRILLRILREEKPEYFAFLLDGKGPNFRHDIFPLYKANRETTPEDLIRQIGPVKRAVQALGLRLEVSDGCEADDCIASLAKRFSSERPVIIVSGDKDLRQCLAANVFLWDPGSREERLHSVGDFRAAYGLEPSVWADMQALMGDTADNIPGVPGIGPKTAERIFREFSSLEDIRDRFSMMDAKLQKKIADHIEAIFMYRELTRLSVDFCKDITLQDLAVQAPHVEELGTLTIEFELNALRREVENFIVANGWQNQSPRPGKNPAGGGEQGTGGSGAPGTEFSGGSARCSADAADGAYSAETSAYSGDCSGCGASGCGGSGVTGSGSGNRTGGDIPAGRASSAHGPAQQMSLFSFAPAPHELPEISDAAVFECSGKDAALLYPRGFEHYPVLAVGDQQWMFTGDIAGLAPRLASARRIVCADVKMLLAHENCWWSIPEALWFDLGVAAYLLNPEEADYGWPKLAADWSAALKLSAQDSGLLALRMADMFTLRLRDNGLTDLFTTLEMPLISVLARMEARGVAIDAKAFTVFLQEVQGELDRLTATIYAQAGGEFNIRSAQQLGEVLFKRLQLPAPRKTQSGQFSTDQTALERLAGEYPVVDSVLHYRKLEKMRSTYLEPLPRLIDSRGRIHTTFNQTATATGRLSSSNPNLQNIPVRGALGKRMRTCFVTREGFKLISADYSQVELRVLAHVSREPTLLEAFRHGEDIHTRTASLIFDVPPSEITPDQRRSAKTINFGLIYGMGAQKLARELEIPQKQAREFIDQYFRRLGRLREFYDSVEASAKSLGLVTTLAGRRRLLPDIYSTNPQAFALARRQAINTVIQGSAADIIKLAMLAVQRDAELSSLDARLVLQVHDELLLEAPAAHAETIARRVSALMSSVAPGGTPLSIPLAVDWGIGTNWGEAH